MTLEISEIETLFAAYIIIVKELGKNPDDKISIALTEFTLNILNSLQNSIRDLIKIKIHLELKELEKNKNEGDGNESAIN